MRFIIKSFLWGVGLGALLAVLRLFDWNPFALIAWVWENIIWWFISGVANLLLDMSWFRDIFSTMV